MPVDNNKIDGTAIIQTMPKLIKKSTLNVYKIQITIPKITETGNKVLYSIIPNNFSEYL